MVGSRLQTYLVTVVRDIIVVLISADIQVFLGSSVSLESCPAMPQYMPDQWWGGQDQDTIHRLPYMFECFICIHFDWSVPFFPEALVSKEDQESY